jgi:Ser/Thr protein kinase RdoA (MazF antagonist)
MSASGAMRPFYDLSPAAQFHRGEVRAIDFDDSGWGYYPYDLAVLLDRLEGRKNYPDLRSALREGYRLARPLPGEFEHHLDAFIMARRVSIGLIFSGRKEDRRFRAFGRWFIKSTLPKLERFLGNL